ncbi:MAG TPA: MFS transporter [Chloroflexus aurantiacus]|jgi:BCD family chlorophyll transporter-like MFS transporter|uniref:PUCC protein n=2 Tax=Chloroflexus TaxID=1107 RepID=A9WIS1_CHLAA|nr:BCD family MFS transporter [Chloroflexus aurantiacus]ABY35798.1 PUCC protein [Chloroflexus aurantiacus J-10-fl]RMG52828.1 MAG: MFS transporter [Chloroflexota bacterium]HBW66680.1 MFS transporter [Chloroflexus aurantiacus]
MSWFKMIRLGMLHVAVAISLVPITGVLNRIMIHELGLMASIVAALIILPHLFSPMQVFIGQFSDRHPFWGYRRTPYIALGLLLCIGGAALTPFAAFAMDASFWPGLALALLVFGIWGVGFNTAVVSYLSLASDMSPSHLRSRTIAVMWFMMITAVIGTAISTGRALEPYSPERLIEVFAICAGVALTVGALGLIGLEPRNAIPLSHEERYSAAESVRTVVRDPLARRFFVYLMLMLSAILGQDVLLEPYGAQAFGMDVRSTTQLTAVWGGATLLALLLHGVVFSRWLSNKRGAMIGGSIAAVGLTLIALSGILHVEPLFVPAIALLGFGTGIATATNLALMLDMTTPQQVGLFIGAWGVADAAARGLGNLLAGVIRDLAALVVGSTGAYATVFLIEALILCTALVMLRAIDVSAFRSQRRELGQLVAAMGDA